MRSHRVSMFLVHGDETLESSEREDASVYAQCVYASHLRVSWTSPIALADTS